MAAKTLQICFLAWSCACWVGCGRAIPDDAEQLARRLGGRVGNSSSDKKPLMMAFPYENLAENSAKDIARIKTVKLLVLEGDKTPPNRISALAELKALPRLGIIIKDAKTTEADLQKLAAMRLPLVDSLVLNGPDLTDKAADYLVQIEGLEFLNLQNSRLTDAGVRRILGKHSQLRGLDLAGAQITDQIVPDLLRVQGLVILGLEGTGLTEIGFKKLVALQNLKYLKVGKTSFTDSALREIKKALPSCQVWDREGVPHR
jgi:hypothetical protein